MRIIAQANRSVCEGKVIESIHKIILDYILAQLVNTSDKLRGPQAYMKERT